MLLLLPSDVIGEITKRLTIKDHSRLSMTCNKMKQMCHPSLNKRYKVSYARANITSSVFISVNCLFRLFEQHEPYSLTGTRLDGDLVKLYLQEMESYIYAMWWNGKLCTTFTKHNFGMYYWYIREKKENFITVEDPALIVDIMNNVMRHERDVWFEGYIVPKRKEYSEAVIDGERYMVITERDYPTISVLLRNEVKIRFRLGDPRTGERLLYIQ